MDPDVFIRHILRLVKTSSGATADPISSLLNAPEGVSLTDDYGNTLKEEASFFEARVPEQGDASAPKAKAKRPPEVNVVRFSVRAAALAAAGGVGAAGAGPFAKVPPRVAPTGAAAPKSALSAVMAIEETKRARLRQQSEVPCRVFFAFQPRTPPVLVTLQHTATMDELTTAALTAYAAEGREPALRVEPLMYLVRLTEDESGRPDDDLPPLDKAQTLKAIGCKDFALCENPNSKAEMLKRKNTEARRDSVTAQTVQPVEPDEVCIKVHLPDDTTATIVCKKLESVGEFVKRVGSRRAVRLEGVSVFLREMPMPLGLTMTMGELRSDEVFIRRSGAGKASAPSTPTGDRSRSLSAAAGPSVVAPAEFSHMFNQFTATLYKEYAVIKTNKAGKRQTRILGIDDKRITNKVTDGEEKRGMMSRLMKKAPKRPYRNIDEVLDVVQLGERFTIHFRGAESTEYEAQSADMASEIVAKIQYLMGMRDAALS